MNIRLFLVYLEILFLRFLFLVLFLSFSMCLDHLPRLVPGETIGRFLRERSFSFRRLKSVTRHLVSYPGAKASA